jgi:hypothetical protein
MRPGEIAAGGPRAAGHAESYRRLVERIARGAERHYGEQCDDPDQALLEGDRDYAEGLAQLAAIGDLEATGQLADVISLVAQAHAAGDRELAEAAWQAGAVAIGWGTSPALEAAKTAARAGAPGAAEALLEAAEERLRGDGLGRPAPPREH